MLRPRFNWLGSWWLCVCPPERRYDAIHPFLRLTTFNTAIFILAFYRSYRVFLFSFVLCFADFAFEYVGILLTHISHRFKQGSHFSIGNILITWTCFCAFCNTWKKLYVWTDLVLGFLKIKRKPEASWIIGYVGELLVIVVDCSVLWATENIILLIMTYSTCTICWLLFEKSIQNRQIEHSSGKVGAIHGWYKTRRKDETRLNIHLKMHHQWSLRYLHVRHKTCWWQSWDILS